MTDNERIIALKAGMAGYCVSSLLATGTIFLMERQTRNKVKKINSMVALLNDFVEFVNEKPVEMSGQDFLDKAIERLNFLSIAGNQIVDGGE